MDSSRKGGGEKPLNELEGDCCACCPAAAAPLL
jgi:hypothetical protein